MAEAQARAEAQPFECHVPLDVETNDAVVEAEDTESDAATDAGTTEQAEASGEEVFPAEELGVDENSPEYQALRKKFIAAYQKKLEAERKKLKPEETAPQAQPATEQPAAAAQQPTEGDDPFDAIYDIDYKSVKPTLTFREGSDLADYGDELTDLLSQAVDQKIEAVLNGIKSNDKKFRQQMTVAERTGKAREAISAYAQEIMDHPEYAEKAGELAAFAQKTQALAIDDPETWIDLVERKFGLERGWRGNESAAAKAEGQNNQRLANKPRSIVARPTRAPVSSGAPSGNMGFDAALQAAMRKAGL